MIVITIRHCCNFYATDTNLPTIPYDYQHYFLNSQLTMGLSQSKTYLVIKKDRGQWSDFKIFKLTPV